MDMYWSQQEVFLMGMLSLFPKNLKSLRPERNDEWKHYFYGKNLDELTKQLKKYEKAGYIEFDEQRVKTMLINRPRYSNEPMFGSMPTSFVIKEVDTGNVTSDLTQYLKNWRNDNLRTNTPYKPDDSAHQHKKLLTALARVYERQNMPRINVEDIFGDDTYYEPPFWETVLAPQLLDKQYEIRQMDYDMDNHEQPFVDIKITNKQLLVKIVASKAALPFEKTQSIKSTGAEWAELKVNRNTVYIRLESGVRYKLKKFRTDNAPLNFINHVLAHPDTDINRSDIQTRVDGCTQKKNMTELVRQCGFTVKLLPLKDVFFAGTTEKKVHFVSRGSLTSDHLDLIESNLTKSN